MKASTAIKRAREHSNKIDALLIPINEKLQEILEDDTAHIVDQAGDGFCILHDSQKLANVGLMDIDKALTMNKSELLDELAKAAI